MTTSTPSQPALAARAPAIAAARVRQYIRTRFNPIRSLTPDLLSQYLDAFKTGYLRQCALVWDAIEERDDTLAGVIAKRKSAASRHGWEILTLAGLPKSLQAEAARHQQALEDFYNHLTVVNAIDENERGEVSLLLRQMMDAVGKKYAVHEIVWKPLSGTGLASGGRRPAAGLTAELRFAPLWFFERITGRLRYLQTEGALEGIEMDDAQWLITVGQGLMAACSVAYMYKSMSLKDWVIYSERHGMPGIHGKTSAAENSDEWNALVEAVQNFAADWAMVTSEGATIDKIDLSTTGQLPYPPLIERMDRAMAALWRGADLSTLSASAGDAGQGASLQGGESEIIEQDDAQWLSETLSRQLDLRVIEYLFGAGTKPLAYIKIKTAQKKNIEQEILVDSFLRDSGAPLAVNDALERFGRSVPEPGAQLLKPPTSAGVGIQGAPFANAAGPALPVSSPDARLATPAPATPSRSDPADIGLFLAAARLQLGEAQAEALAPIRARLSDILAGPDTELAAALERLRFDLPELLRQINLEPKTRKILEDTLAAALLNGLASEPAAPAAP